MQILSVAYVNCNIDNPICLFSAGLEYLVFLAFFELAIGSSIALLTCYQAVNILCKKNKAFYICLMSGAVDSSTAVFILFLYVGPTVDKL